jgi:hypothetical protein
MAGSLTANIRDLTGTVVRIESNKQNASEGRKIQVFVNEVITLEWSYVAVPDEIPVSVFVSTDSDCIQINEIRQLRRPGLGGAGTLILFCFARQLGSCTLVWRIVNSSASNISLNYQFSVGARK